MIDLISNRIDFEWINNFTFQNRQICKSFNIEFTQMSNKTKNN